MFLSCIQIDSFVSDQVFTLRICYPQLCLHQMIVMQLWAPELRLSQSLNGHQRVELARFVSLSWARADHSGHFFLLVLSSCLPTFPLKGYTNLCLAVPTLLKKKKTLFQFDLRCLQISESWVLSPCQRTLFWKKFGFVSIWHDKGSLTKNHALVKIMYIKKALLK